jgi:hypothetical protein
MAGPVSGAGEIGAMGLGRARSSIETVFGCNFPPYPESVGGTSTNDYAAT